MPPEEEILPELTDTKGNDPDPQQTELFASCSGAQCCTVHLSIHVMPVEEAEALMQGYV